MKITSAWSVVEHEDHLVLSISLLKIGDLVAVAPEEDVIHIAVIKENKEKAARFHHKDGMKMFSIKMNQKFLKIVKDYGGLPDATAILFMKKLKLKKELSAVRISDLDE
ncbi:hypothetical protein MKW92_029871 [Papaver armeniacum]|nr:hypothetical protein MKW92_029871 [Papaver armeniacum]